MGWTTFLLCLSFGVHLSAFECNPKDHCTCYPDDFEIHCPTMTEEDIIIHFYEQKSEILIDCPYTLEKFDLHQLPKVVIDVKNFRMRFCPWLEEEFRRIFDKFSLENVTFLEFSASSSKNVILKDHYFKDLGEIQILNLINVGIVDIDEDVFIHTPNLIILELSDNNVTLKRNMFRNVPLLTFLDLSGNSLENIPPGAFQSLEKLKTLHLWNNKLRTLDGQVFNGLISLQSLELSRNEIEDISEDAFHEMRNLEQINLSANRIKQVAPNLFKHNKKLKLVKMKSNFQLKLSDYLFENLFISQIDLSNCSLKSIPKHIFENCVNLKSVNLARNELKILPANLFKGLVDLEHIRLQYNRIESVDKVFQDLKRLKSLYLQNNFISVLNFQDFADLIHLEKINLKGNRISVIDVKLFDHKSNLQVINLSHNYLNSSLDQIMTFDAVKTLNDLDLSHNFISKLKLDDVKPVPNISIKLDHNQISVVDFENVDLYSMFARISLGHNPIACDCRNLELMEYFRKRGKEAFTIDISAENLRCGNAPRLKLVSVITSPQLLTCRLDKLSPNYTSCPKKCLCSWRPSDKSVVIDCSYKNLTEFPQIDLNRVTSVEFNQTEMNFEGNDLKTGPEHSIVFDNVTRLFLSGNKIRTIQWLPQRLEVLTLDHNDLSHLNHDVVKTLTQAPLINVTLHANPWRCVCGSEVLADFLLTHTTQVHTREILCRNSTKLLINLKKDDFCNKWNNADLILMVLLVLLVASICGVIYYSQKQQLKVWLFSKNMCLWWVTEQELDKDKTYDAFLSFSHKDEDFVIGNLLPGLESRYKLCLHYRDWTPGELISTQIENSVLESRRTVVVLSKNFLESVWGKMEFRTAHSQAISDGRTRVIILLLEDIDVRDLDDELKMYLKSNTYVKWGDLYFWEKLKYALPHKRIASSRRHRMISEDCTLIHSNPSSPGCTPPISLNSSFVKINPLTFLNGRENKL